MRVLDILESAAPGGAWLPVADAVVKATILLACAALTSAALRRASAAARHLIWTLALVSALALPALSLALPRWQLPIVTLASNAPGVSDAPDAAPAIAMHRDAATVKPADAVNESAPAASPMPSAPSQVTSSASSLPQLSWTAIIAMVWGAGALLVLGRLALGLLAVQWMSRRTERVADAPWLALARRLAAEIGVTPRIRFLRSRSATMPMAWGIFRPAVLMPSDADAWPDHRLRVVLLHELAHVKRRDCLTHLVAQVACALYWFNPLAWMAARHVRTERERACDDLVLASGTRSADYADQLLEIARVMRAGRFPGVLAGASLAMAHRSQLEGRLMAILDPTVPRAGVTRLRTICAATFFGVALMPLASMQPWAYAAAPDLAEALPAAAQNPTPTPTPMPTPMPTPTPMPSPDVRTEVAVNGVVRDVVPGVVTAAVDAAVQGSVQGAVQSSVQGSIQEALQGSIQGAVQGALQGRNAPNFAHDIDTQETVQEPSGRKGADPKAVAALTAALKDADKDVRETALQALVQMRDPGIYEPLMQALSDPAADVRQQAAFGLGQLRDRRAVPALTKASKDADADVRQQAVFALGQLRDPAAIDALMGAMRDEKPDVRQQAVFALGQIRDRRAVEPLVSALKDADADVRQQAAFGLGQIRDRAAVEPLIVALKDSAADVRQQAAFALGQIRDTRAIDGLTDALKDSSADVRQQAAFALGQIAR